MITDWFISFVVGIVKPLVDLLPQVSLTIPGSSSVVHFLNTLDYLLPIMPVLKVALVILAAGVGFFAIRAFVFIWQQVKW